MKRNLLELLVALSLGPLGAVMTLARRGIGHFALAALWGFSVYSVMFLFWHHPIEWLAFVWSTGLFVFGLVFIVYPKKFRSMFLVSKRSKS